MGMTSCSVVVAGLAGLEDDAAGGFSERENNKLETQVKRKKMEVTYMKPLLAWTSFSSLVVVVFQWQER